MHQQLVSVSLPGQSKSYSPLEPYRPGIFTVAGANVPLPATVI
jgi:hypothetical protein